MRRPAVHDRLGAVEHVELAPRRIAQMEPTAKAELRRLLGVALRGDLVPAHNASPTLELPTARAAAMSPAM